jgi:outer membrane protein assembly factor BamB
VIKTLINVFILIIGNFFTPALGQELTTEPLWRIETGQTIYTKPVIDGDILYTGGEKGVLRAIDKETGKVKWTYRAEAAIASGAGFDDTRVYVMSRDGVVHGVDKTNGKGLWTFSTEGEKQWDYWDFFLSTPVADDKHWLYFGSGDHHIYSINKRTGAFRWKVETGAIVHGSPVLSGEKVIVGGFDGKMYALDQANGNILWTFKTVGNSYFRDGEIAGSPAVADGIVYFGSRDYNLYAVLEETGTGAWNERTPSWVVAKPLMAEGNVYVAISDGPRIFSFNAKSGSENWMTRLGLNVFGGAETLGDNHIAVAGFDGRISFIGRETGEIVGFHDTTEAKKKRSSLFDEGGKLQPGDIKTFEDLFALYDRYFAELGGIAGGLAVDGDTIYYATGVGGISAIRVSGLSTEKGSD